MMGLIDGNIMLQAAPPMPMHIPMLSHVGDHLSHDLGGGDTRIDFR